MTDIRDVLRSRPEPNDQTWPNIEESVLECRKALKDAPKSPDYPYVPLLHFWYLEKVMLETCVHLGAVIQRLESHAEGCCHLDARDRNAIVGARQLLGLMERR